MCCGSLGRLPGLPDQISACGLSQNRETTDIHGRSIVASIRVGIVGVGNCAKSLVEGVTLYLETGRTNGLAFQEVGGYRAADLQFVLAYDVDRRKVGLPIPKAVKARPNLALDLTDDVSVVCDRDARVLRGRRLDGVADHMVGERGFLPVTDGPDVTHGPEPTEEEVARQLARSRVDVLVLYLPVGSQAATEFYVRAALRARVPFVNCIPVFVVSDPVWGRRIEEAGIPAVGDDMRSQVGASVLSQCLQEMFLTRGATVRCHLQQNSGGNTDFMNMLDRSRLASKKRSKENVITSQNELRGVAVSPESVHAGPSDYVPYLGDNKVAHIRIEADIFGGAPVTLDCRLSVQDSPNSAGVVIDAVRYVQVARELGTAGPLAGASAFTQKTPPVQMPLAAAYEECSRLARRERPGTVSRSQEDPQRSVVPINGSLAV